MGKSTVRYAVLDGVVRAFALFVVLDYATSVYADGQLALFFGIVAVAVLTLPLLLGTLSFKKSDGLLSVGKYTLLSGGVYVVLAVMFLPVNELPVNELTVNIHLLPMRELGYGDGLMLLYSLPALLLINLIGRAATLAVMWSKQKAAA